MTHEIEIEFKNLLSKNMFYHLLKKLPFPEKGVQQINYYFETESFALRKNASALRIREKQQSFTMTLKEPAREGLLETHDVLTEEEKEAWINGDVIPKPNVTKRLKLMQIDPYQLKYVGKLTTIRHEFSHNGFIYVLDKSMYNHVTDYELEMEAPDYASGKISFQKFLKKYAIPKNESKNKIERFFATKIE